MNAKRLVRFGIAALFGLLAARLAVQAWFVLVSGVTANRISGVMARLKRAAVAVERFRSDHPGEALGPRWTERLARYDPGLTTALRTEGGVALALTPAAVSRSVNDLPPSSVVLAEYRSAEANPVVRTPEAVTGSVGPTYVGLVLADGTVQRLERGEVLRRLGFRASDGRG